MLLQREQLRHLNCVAHEGKVVLVATDGDGRLFYTIRQDGFEDSYLKAASAQPGWEDWQPLDLPNEPDDASVVEKETAELTYVNPAGRFVLRSLYRTHDQTAVAPVQLVSGLEHIYIFRQSRSGTLLCDRFVLDGVANRLSRKYQIRYKRSRQKYKASESMQAVPGGLKNVDTLDFRDTRDNYFYEPTTELCLVQNLLNGWFQVVLCKTNEHDQYRWHIFSYNSDPQVQKIEIVSLRASDEGLFEIADQVSWGPRSDGDATLISRRSDGIIRRTLNLGALQVTGGPAATLYDLQQERDVPFDGGRQLMRVTTRLMLAVPTSQGTATLSFGIAADGTLAQVAAQGTPQIVRRTERELLLPTDTLDNAKALGSAPPVRGTIDGMRLATDADGGQDKVVVTSQAASLSHGDVVRITDTTSYDGIYRVSGVSEGSFKLSDVSVSGGLGQWEKKEEQEGGLYFDGMVTAFEKTADGKLRVTALNHGLADGDEVQLLGTRSQNDTYPITRLDDGHFVIDRTWPAGEAVNVRLASRKRRGLMLDGVSDYISLTPKLIPQGQEISIGFWLKAGAANPRNSTLFDAVNNSNRLYLRIHIAYGDRRVYFICGYDSRTANDQLYKQLTDAELNELKSGFTHWFFTKNVATGEMKIYRNGAVWAQGLGRRPLQEVSKFEVGRSADNGSGYYDGTISELSIWSRVLGEAEIKSVMHLPLSGNEPGLCGYFRLGAVAEGAERKVLDLAGDRHGTVFGGAAPSPVALLRKLRDGTSDAVKYRNDELLAVSQGGTYEESFEFRVIAATPVSIQASSPLFKINPWGRKSRGATDDTSIPAAAPSFSQLEGGWYSASCQYTIPEGVPLLRSFEISEVTGTWERIEIRKHRIRLISDAITQAVYTDTLTPTPVGSDSAELNRLFNVLDAREQQLAQLLQEKTDLEAIAEIDSLTREIATQTAEVERLRARMALENNSPLNRECQLNCRVGSDWKFIQVSAEGGEVGQGLLRQGAARDGAVFKFTKLTEDTYNIAVKVGDLWKPVWILDGDIALTSFLYCSSKTPGQTFRISDAGSSNYVLSTLYKGAWKGVQVWLQDSTAGKPLVPSSDASPGNTFYFLSSTQRTNDAYEKAREAWESSKAALEAKQARLSRLQTANTLTAAERTARLAQIETEVGTLRPELKRAHGEFAAGARTARPSLAAMPQLSRDARGLTTTGSLLSSVRPTGRLSVLATCEGNVELSYFDERGRMRRLAFDACSDSRNTTYEQWLPEAPKTCIDLGSNDGVLQPDSPIYVPESFTIETWFYHPLPPREWNSLTSSESDDNLVAVLRGRYLGMRSGGFFYSSGYSLAGLSAGWHHLAAVRRTTAGKAMVEYYIDGASVARITPPLLSALSLDGSNDYVDLSAQSVPAGREISICFWARGADSRSASQEALVLDAADGTNRRLAISLPTAAGKVRFDCGDANGVDFIEHPVTARDLNGKWVHWAFTKNAASGVMRIYKNGQLLREEQQKTRSLSAVSRACVGKAATAERARYAGGIAELCILNRELSAREILERVGVPWTGKEEGVVACFRAEADKLRELSASGRHGTVAGDPPLSSLSITAASQVGLIGNCSVDSQEEAAQVNCISLDGVDDAVEFPASAFPTGNEVSICFWANAGANNPRQAVLLNAFGTAENRQLFINVPWENTPGDNRPQIYFDCGGPATKTDNYDRLVRPAPTDYKGSWTHWAFIKNAATGLMTLYRNGVSFYQETNKRQPLLAVASLIMGKYALGSTYYHHGLVSELSIWNKALSEEELKTLKGRTLTGAEAGLCGYWRFDANRATDLSPNARHGTYIGGPSIVANNGPAGLVRSGRAAEDETFGKLAEVRVWEVALSAGEIAAHSKTTLTGNEPGLLAYYPLNDPGAGQKVMDLSPRGNHAALLSTLETLVLQLDGKGDAITAADRERLRLTTYTVECWIYPNGQPDEQFKGIIGKPGRGFNIWLQSDGALLHNYHTTTGTMAGHVTQAGVVPWNQWTHVAITNNGVSALTYVNGVKVGEGTVSGQLVADNTELRIGCNLDGIDSQYFKGRMAEVRIWRVARSAAELQEKWKKRLTGTEPDLVAYLPLNQIQGSGSARKVIDMTGATEPVVKNASAAIDHLLPLGPSYSLSEDAWCALTAPIGHLGARVLRFDGKNAVAQPGVRLIEGAAAFTLEGWVKPTGPGGNYVALFGQADSIEFGISAQRLSAFISGLYFASSRPWYTFEWHHVALVGTGTQVLLYMDGALEYTINLAAPYGPRGAGGLFKIGAGVWGTARRGNFSDAFQGVMAEVRVWNRARSADEIRAGMYRRMHGSEPGLTSCLPLDELSSDGAATPVYSILDRCDRQRRFPVERGTLCGDGTLPIAPESVVAAEYSTIATDPSTQRKLAMMRRFLAAPLPGGALLLPDKRIESLDLRWIGNCQFAPTLLGYIEGAPPVPSENLTVDLDYRGATSVELSTSQDVELRWNRAQDVGGGLNLDMFLGTETDTYVGFGGMVKMSDVRAGFKGSFNTGYSYRTESNVTARSTQRMTDRLELRGSAEQSAKFPHLGARFVPKNVGYALVISGIADVFVSRLARSGKMVGSQTLPVEGLPPDVNTITFLLNPAYTMQGSLDGLTGSRATSDRFFRHVPEMRAQYGALYPASYYRLKEAYALKEQIESDDKRRESYFAQFDSMLVDESSLQREAESGGAPVDVTVKRQEDEAPAGASQEDKEAATRKRTDGQKEAAAAGYSEQSSVVKRKRKQIEQQIEDHDQQVHAKASLENWQKKMEAIRQKAGKRHIVNTYVWDADGGLHTEAQSFASTVEHSMGGSFTLDGNVGAEGAFGVGATKVELTALAAINLSQSMQKTESRSTGVELTVDLSGVESSGITDHNDKPVLPGEKVDRYRFMSFYLAASTDHFHDFFRYVVDPEWLQSNSEEARALRQAMGKANKTWRVLHRVTYVERPALMGFGRDLRQAGDLGRGTEAILNYFDQLAAYQAMTKDRFAKLEQQQKDLAAKIDQILGKLTK